MMKIIENQIITGIVCNKCGRKLTMEKDCIIEGYFQADYTFGYFSNKDGENHQWDLCEDCYDAIVAAFQIPVTEKEETELV